MKKKILCMMLIVLLAFVGAMPFDATVFAVESEDIDMSLLMNEDAITGYADNMTWGVYLASGTSTINKISSTKVGAGGTTNAAKKCTVRITSILERKNSSGSWERVISWTQTNQDSFNAMISKSVTVPSGYYYRVRSYHYASTDTASSHTNALWVGN